MKISKIDFTKKENQTFKNWFKLMWSNGYIQLFPLGITMIIYSIVKWFEFDFIEILGLEFNGAWTMFLLGIFMSFFLAYKGFYQFWKDIKKP